MSPDLAPNRGVLLVNLGSPDSPSVPDVRRYLGEFLMDGRVIDAPFPIRWMIVNLFILPFRPKQSAHAYQSIWWPEGSPLVTISKRAHQAVKAKASVPVELAMRYGTPSIEYGIDQLLRANSRLTQIDMLPLYPHFAMSTIETSVVLARDILRRKAPAVRLNVFPPYFNDPDYITALAASAAPYLQQDYDYLLFSYHGLPERHLRKTDPTGAHCLKVEDCCHVASAAHPFCYRHQTLATTQALVKKLNIPAEKYSVAYQSRLGNDPWLKPATDQELIRLAKAGVKKLLVICPAFVSDCLETLEEIGIRGKESFLEHGGTKLQEIPCMNEHSQWIETLAKWCNQPERFVAAK